MTNNIRSTGMLKEGTARLSQTAKGWSQHTKFIIGFTRIEHERILKAPESVHESSRKERTWECIYLGTTMELEEKAPVYEYD
eukprot:7279444-Heterocapsa_arctica.AAC.1